MVDSGNTPVCQEIGANGARNILDIARELGIAALKKADSWKPPSAFADQEYGLLWDAAITSFLECLRDIEFPDHDLDAAAVEYLMQDPQGNVNLNGIQAAWRELVLALILLHRQKEGA